jgi:hypothetical protein
MDAVTKGKFTPYMETDLLFDDINHGSYNNVYIKYVVQHLKSCKQLLP